jgi:PTS system mannose-specific IIA component
MIGVVVVTHGQLAIELLNAAEMIVGDLPQFTAVSIGWHDDVTDAREDIAQAIERVKGDGGVLLLTDMFGGTSSNLGMTFLEANEIEVITGVNLPMLIKLASSRVRPICSPSRARCAIMVGVPSGSLRTCCAGTRRSQSTAEIAECAEILGRKRLKGRLGAFPVWPCELRVLCG